jgi:hypothetical protein
MGAALLHAADTGHGLLFTAGEATYMQLYHSARSTFTPTNTRERE